MPADLWPVERGGRRTAARDNALLAHLQRQVITSVNFRVTQRAPFAHPWKVTAERFTPPDGYGGPLAADRTWRIEVAAGTVNDAQPGILYRRRNDPRGWTPPDGYRVPVPGGADYDPEFIERFADDDPEDPPCLILRDPEKDATDARDWTRVSDDDRPDTFKSEGDWEREVWSASVILSASPITSGLFIAAAPPRLARYRLYTLPQLPSPLWGASAGGWREIATIWLLRDPESPDSAEIQIRQREWWPLRAVIVQPGADIIADIDTIAGIYGDALTQYFADQARTQVEDILQGASRVEWWTV